MIRERARSEMMIGGGELILAFLQEALRSHVEHLVVVTPYVDDSAFGDRTLMSLWQRTIAITDSTIVVRTSRAADAVLRSVQLARCRCSLRINPRLHAKAFLAWRSGVEVALVGSHNLTDAALRANKELGILIKPATGGVKAIVSELRSALEGIVSTSNFYSAAGLLQVSPSLPDRNPAVTGIKG